MAITVFNKENVDAVREAVTFALRSLPESHGLNCKCGHITYDKTTLTISVNVETLMHGFYMKELFKQNAVRMGLQPTDFGRTFRDKKHIYIQ